LSTLEAPKDVASKILAILRGFRVLMFFYVAFLGVGLCVFALGSVFPWLDGVLLASRSTPWGVVTSLFAHSDLGHLAMNLVGLLSFFLIFPFTNYFLPGEEKAGRVVFFLAAVLASTVLSNVVWIVIVNIGSMGASGLVYASEGAVTGFCLVNFWDIYSGEGPGAGGGRGALLVNLLVFVPVCVWMVFYTSSFLSYGRDVNVLIHGSSFVLAFILAIEWGNVKKVLGIGGGAGA